MIEMKDSGVECIGDIPKNWTMAQVRYLFSIGRGRVIAQTELKENGQYPVYSSQTKNNGCLGYIDTYDFDIDQITWTTDGANAGTVFYRQGKYNCTNVCGTLQPIHDFLDLKYQKFALEHIAFYHKRADTNGYKIMNNEMAAIHTLVPPLDIQHRIADYLDNKCSKIDAIIEKEQAVIEKLKEYKLSVITEAVTKGLNPDVEIKETNSVWFDKIPLNWNIKRLKYVFHIQKNIAGEEGHTVLSITQKGIIPKDFSNFGGQFANSYANYQLVHVGDFAMNHMDLLTGWVDISKYEGVTSPDYRVFVLNDTKEYYSKYYLYLMQMCYSAKIFYGLGQGVSGLGRWRLQADKFLNFWIPIPPVEEQIAIANHLERKCTSIDASISHKVSVIEKLTEYKKSLIYEVVTGKREVL